MLAIPLFLPILLFIDHFERLSSSELIARNLVRESLRAYVTSPNPVVAPSRANQTLVEAAKAAGLKQDEINEFKVVGDKKEIVDLAKDKNVFAKFKNYNKTARAKEEDALKNMIMKANNKYKNKGRICDYTFLQTKEYIPQIKQKEVKPISFAEFKKSRLS
mgnify:CR=1 FL=1